APRREAQGGDRVERVRVEPLGQPERVEPELLQAVHERRVSRGGPRPDPLSAVRVADADLHRSSHRTERRARRAQSSSVEGANSSPRESTREARPCSCTYPTSVSSVRRLGPTPYG